MLSRATARSLLDTPEELPTARKLIKIFQPCPGRDNEVFAQVSCMPSSEGKQLHTCMPADKNPVDENERYWAVELDLEPFKAHFPVMTRPSSIGDGVRFLNRCRTLSHHPQTIPHCSWSGKPVCFSVSCSSGLLCCCCFCHCQAAGMSCAGQVSFGVS